MSARRERSSAAEQRRGALIDLSEAITTSSQQKMGRRRPAASSVSRITDGGGPSPDGDPDRCDNKTRTSQVRRVPPPPRGRALTTSDSVLNSSHRMFHLKKQRLGLHCFNTNLQRKHRSKKLRLLQVRFLNNIEQQQEQTSRAGKLQTRRDLSQTGQNRVSHRIRQKTWSLI